MNSKVRASISIDTTCKCVRSSKHYTVWVNHIESKADVHQDEVPNLCLRRVGETDLTGSAAKARTQCTIVGVYENSQLTASAKEIDSASNGTTDFDSGSIFIYRLSSFCTQARVATSVYSGTIWAY